VPALVESASPGLSGVDMPMAPLNLSTGMRAPRPVQEAGSMLPNRSKTEGRSSSRTLSMQPKVQRQRVKSRPEVSTQAERRCPFLSFA
jgi:hypothetical protein